MSNIDKRALREAAEKAISEEGETWWSEEQLASDYGLALHKADAKFIAAANPATVLALLDELEAAEKLIAELEVVNELFLRAKALMYQSGGTPIDNSLNPIDAWLYDAERAAAAGKGE
ncbi:ead/Ea22-like family protein [Escherichia coli]